MLLAELPDRERELLALKYGSGLTNREIAGLTGVSESNIGTILYRTLRRLRTLWDEGGTRMDDQFLYDFREDPSSEFAENLRRKLREQPASSAQMSRVPIWRKPTAVAVGVAAVFLISLSFPAVRAVAQQFLICFAFNASLPFLPIPSASNRSSESPMKALI